MLISWVEDGEIGVMENGLGCFDLEFMGARPREGNIIPLFDIRTNEGFSKRQNSHRQSQTGAQKVLIADRLMTLKIIQRCFLKSHTFQVNFVYVPIPDLQ